MSLKRLPTWFQGPALRTTRCPPASRGSHPVARPGTKSDQLSGQGDKTGRGAVSPRHGCCVTSVSLEPLSSGACCLPFQVAVSSLPGPPAPCLPREHGLKLQDPELTLESLPIITCSFHMGRGPPSPVGSTSGGAETPLQQAQGTRGCETEAHGRTAGSSRPHSSTGLHSLPPEARSNTHSLSQRSAGAW